MSTPDWAPRRSRAATRLDRDQCEENCPLGRQRSRLITLVDVLQAVFGDPGPSTLKSNESVEKPEKVMKSKTGKGSPAERSLIEPVAGGSKTPAAKLTLV